jgi:hypothetical protein
MSRNNITCNRACSPTGIDTLPPARSTTLLATHSPAICCASLPTDHLQAHHLARTIRTHTCRPRPLRLSQPDQNQPQTGDADPVTQNWMPASPHHPWQRRQLSATRVLPKRPQRHHLAHEIVPLNRKDLSITSQFLESGLYTGKSKIVGLRNFLAQSGIPSSPASLCPEISAFSWAHPRSPRCSHLPGTDKTTLPTTTSQPCISGLKTAK